MSNMNLDRAKKIQEAIKKLFLDEWDPIGIRDIPGANSEYDAYVSAIYKMLIARKTREEIFEYLWWVENQHMGLVGDRQLTGRIVNEVVAIFSAEQSWTRIKH